MKKIIFGVIIMLAIVVWFLIRDDVKSVTIEVVDFATCTQAGNPVLETYPRQCVTADGDRYTEDIGNELEMVDKIKALSPRPNDLMTSPFEVTGNAVGNWFFEASFPLELIDANGHSLSKSYAMTSDEWMTTDFVGFLGTIEFEDPQTDTGILILAKDNPSGLEENENSLRIPVRFK